mmetsp:Transcript_4255/g.12250  ORF Transcript_4255/g.12250 Transcript_4255/m.12250 type:complete len:218 (-) Transcript_4255:602-1255(-)
MAVPLRVQLPRLTATDWWTSSRPGALRPPAQLLQLHLLLLVVSKTAAASPGGHTVRPCAQQIAHHHYHQAVAAIARDQSSPPTPAREQHRKAPHEATSRAELTPYPARTDGDTTLPELANRAAQSATERQPAASIRQHACCQLNAWVFGSSQPRRPTTCTVSRKVNPRSQPNAPHGYNMRSWASWGARTGLSPLLWPPCPLPGALSKFPSKTSTRNT